MHVVENKGSVKKRLLKKKFGGKVLSIVRKEGYHERTIALVLLIYICLDSAL